jgi:integrase
MPKRLHVDLSSRRARTRLAVRDQESHPYWHLIAKGRSLGYRPLSAGGTWLVRYRSSNDDGTFRYGRLGLADDTLAADGAEVLDYSQAVRAALHWCDQQEGRITGEAPIREPYTVAQAMADYLDWFRAHRKSIATTELKVKAHILPAFGDQEVDKLTVRQIRLWHQVVAASPARMRPPKGGTGRVRPIETPDDRRRRKSTANRVLAVLKAALNMAIAEGRVRESAGIAWRGVRLFKGVDAPRIRFFDREEVLRLLAACQPDFRALVVGALFTGCRYGELTGLLVRDYLPDSRAIQITDAKGGSPRVVFLNDEATTYFKSLVAGRGRHERMFQRADGTPWLRSQQGRRMRDALSLAHIPPPASFHVLRHTYASHYLMGGGSLPGLARQLGHADVRMTLRSYAHLANQWRAAEAQQYGPRFGITLEAAGTTPA